MVPAPADDSPLIGALMRMPVEAVRHRMLQDLHASGFTDVVPAHFDVFRYPGPEGRRPSDLAAEAGTTKQAMNYLLGQLEQLGYLVRSADAADRRSRRIHLTARGKAVRRRLRATVTAIEQELEIELGPTEFARLRALLVRLNDSQLVVEFRHLDG